MTWLRRRGWTLGNFKTKSDPNSGLSSCAASNLEFRELGPACASCTAIPPAAWFLKVALTQITWQPLREEESWKWQGGEQVITREQSCQALFIFMPSNTSAINRRRRQFRHQGKSIVHDGEAAVSKSALARCPQITHLDLRKAHTVRMPSPVNHPRRQAEETTRPRERDAGQKKSPALWPWLAANPPCGLAQATNLSGPWFSPCRMKGVDITILASGFFLLLIFCFSDDFENLYFRNPHLKVKPISSSCQQSTHWCSETIWNADWWIISIWSTIFWSATQHPSGTPILFCRSENRCWFFYIFSCKSFSFFASELGTEPTF